LFEFGFAERFAMPYHPVRDEEETVGQHHAAQARHAAQHTAAEANRQRAKAKNRRA